MWRYFAGGVAALLLAAAGIVLWRGAQAEPIIPPAPAAQAASETEPQAVPEPPAATEKTREERRFGRYDKDKDGAITRDEYLAQRRKAFAKLDTNGDGRLSFEEYAVKTAERFAKADADRSRILTPAEFATTRVVRKARPAARCDCGDQVTAALAAREED